MTATANTSTADQPTTIRDHAMKLLALLDHVDPAVEPFYVDGFVHEVLQRFHKIAPIWAIEDVKGLRPHLTDEQAWDVLYDVGDKHDAEWGISYGTLSEMADYMFPASETDDDEEQKP